MRGRPNDEDAVGVEIVRRLEDGGWRGEEELQRGESNSRPAVRRREQAGMGREYRERRRGNNTEHARDYLE
jgi:hypothetical protein